MHSQQGAMAEWLGNGLQNHVQQFDSAWHLDFLFCLYENHSFLFSILLHGIFHFLTDFEFMQ